MALLEREPSLAALHQYAADARQGEGRLVLLAGEAGVGKSVLVEHFHTALADATWAWGTCDGLSTPRPLGPLFDIAHDLGGGLRELCEQAQPGRDQLFHMLLHAVTGDETFRVLVIEDIHWADEATLDLLRFLGRRIRTARVLVIATYRDNSLSGLAPLRLALGELATLRWTRRLDLAPLSSRAVGLLAAQTELDPKQLYELTGGNPFYVTEMIQAGTHDVPLSARDAVLARTARLNDDAAAVLSCASLIGTRVPPALLTSATRCSAVVLDELVASGLLVTDGPALRFSHEIARLAVEQQIATHRRSAIQADILTALEAAGSNDHACMAFHAEGAGNDVAALHYASIAAHQAHELGSHRESAAQYERALRSAAGVASAVVAELYTGLAHQASLGDDWQTAADAYEQALRLWRHVDDQRHEGTTLRLYSIALASLCRGDDSLGAAQQAVAILEPLGPSSELAAAYGTLAAAHMMRSTYTTAIELARQAQAMARTFGAVEVIADSLNTEGCSLCASDSHWSEPLRRSLELALSHNLQTQAARAYNNLHSTLTDQFRFREAEQHFVDGLAYCIERDLASFAYCLRSARTMTLTMQGRWDEALTMSMRLLEESTTSPLNRIGPYTRIGLIHARRGDHGVWQVLDQALAEVIGTNQPQCIGPVRIARAEAFWLEGRADDAVREVDAAADLADDLDSCLRGAAQLWLRRLGSERRVDGEIAEPYRLALLGRRVDAARAWDEIGCGYDAAMTLLDASDEDSLRSALQRLDELGATATARLARQKLRKLGVRSIPVGPRRATRAHPYGLTPRERQVLELVCARRTNAEIAQELFISAKTVDHHVSAVLAKLDAENREGAAATAMRLGLVAPAAAQSIS